ncbi:MAG: DUF5132 domain-containing protein [Defluviicoccus sp.]
MALLDELLKRNVITGLAIGIGVTVLGPILLPPLVRAVKPAAKAAIKSGLVLLDKGRETLAELGEMTEDIVAEAKAELAQEAEAVAGTASTAAEAASGPTQGVA